MREPAPQHLKALFSLHIKEKECIIFHRLSVICGLCNLILCVLPSSLQSAYYVSKLDAQTVSP